MSPQITKILFPALTGVFAVHAVAFGWLYHRRGRVKYALLVGTFLCLSVVYLSRTLHWEIGFLRILLRVAAIGCAVAAILLRKR